MRPPKPTIETIEAVPYFDLELYMILSQNKRVDSQTAFLVEELWNRYKPHLNIRRITIQSTGYLAVWLDKFVEDEVNALWDSSPSQAFTSNSLAQAMCMAVVREHTPEVAMNSCAPVPKPNPPLRKALSDLGLAWEGQDTLGRQYAMLTYMPYRGGCEICYLQKSCPKATVGKMLLEEDKASK